MEVLQTRVMHGPNYWSATNHQLIVLKVRLQGADLLIGKNIEVLSNRLAALHLKLELPGNCITIAQLTAQVAVALQTMAGMHCNLLRVSSTDDPAVFYVVFTYVVESAGRYAAQTAVRIVNALTAGIAYEVQDDLQKLRSINRREALGPSTRALTDEAERHNIPVTRLDNSALIMLGHGCNQHIIRAAVANSTSAIAVEVVSDKELTKKILADGRIPTPQGRLISSLPELEDAVTALRFPLVIKPLNGNHGRGITTHLQSYEDAVEAFHLAQKISRNVIVERHIQGHDFRFLIINYKLVAAAKRTPAAVIGNGVATISELVEETNKDLRRGTGHENVLTQITIDDNTRHILAKNNLTADSVLPMGQIQYLKDTANISTGGTADDVTDQIHPQNVQMVERVSRLMNLDICGIDIMTEDVAIPITKQNGAVLEVNAGPGLRMHLAPSNGLARNVAVPIIQMLYRANAPARIPLVAVTGTNGKTTTTRLVAHIARHAGYCVGFTTTDGIYINGQLIEQGDCSGPSSAGVVLRDSLVNFAVLECARGGILRAGLGFDQCTISITTNISADHLGLDGIDTIEELAKVKAVVAKSTATNGYAILNADDDLVYKIKDDLLCNIALFSLNPGGNNIQEHISRGCIAAVVDDGYFTIYHGEQTWRVISVAEVPLTFEGTAESMVKNVLPAILAAYIQGIPLLQIQGALREFKPSAENTPGRMNHFAFNDFNVIVDYAHNEGGYRELKKYADRVDASVKTGIIAATGDRREQDIINLGSITAQIFDELIIKHDKDRRGKTKEQITELLLQGIRQVKPEMPVKVISDEVEAVKYAIDHARKNAWIFVNVDKVQQTLDFVAQAQQQDHLKAHTTNSVMI